MPTSGNQEHAESCKLLTESHVPFTQIGYRQPGTEMYTTLADRLLIVYSDLVPG